MSWGQDVSHGRKSADVAFAPWLPEAHSSATNGHEIRPGSARQTPGCRWAANSGAVVDSGGWNTVLAATANPGREAGHVLIHAVGQDGDVHFYDHLAADTGGASWSPISGVAVLSGWTD